MNNFVKKIIGRPGTVKTQKSLFFNWIEPHLPDSDENLTEELMSSMVQRWIEADLSPGTIKGLISLLKKYIKWKVMLDLPTAPLVRMISRMRVQEPIKAWSKEDCVKALDAARQLDSELYKMMMVTLHTGCRKGELLGLRWEDFDILRGRITISRSYDGPTKSGRPRQVPLSDALESLLFEGYIIGEESKLVFKRCDPNDRLEAICKVAGVPRLTFHGLRHTFSSLALEAGRSPKQVSTVLGHTKVSTTIDLYWHLIGEDMNMDFLP